MALLSKGVMGPQQPPENAAIPAADKEVYNQFLADVELYIEQTGDLKILEKKFKAWLATRYE